MMAEDVKLSPAGGVELPPPSSGGVTVSASGIPARAAAVGITPSGTGVGSTRGTMPGPVRTHLKNKTKPCTIPLRIVTPTSRQLSHTDGICLSRQLAADSWLFALRTDLCNRLCQYLPTDYIGGCRQCSSEQQAIVSQAAASCSGMCHLGEVLGRAGGKVLLGAVVVVNSRYSRIPQIMHLLLCLFFIRARFQVEVWATHTPGVQNGMADAISRNNLHYFFSQAPDAQRRRIAIPPALVALLVEQRPDWTSQTWTRLFETSFQLA